MEMVRFRWVDEGGRTDGGRWRRIEGFFGLAFEGLKICHVTSDVVIDAEIRTARVLSRLAALPCLDLGASRLPQARRLLDRSLQPCAPSSADQEREGRVCHKCLNHRPHVIHRLASLVQPSKDPCAWLAAFVRLAKWCHVF